MSRPPPDSDEREGHCLGKSFLAWCQPSMAQGAGELRAGPGPLGHTPVLPNSTGLRLPSSEVSHLYCNQEAPEVLGAQHTPVPFGTYQPVAVSRAQPAPLPTGMSSASFPSQEVEFNAREHLCAFNTYRM